MCSSVFGTNEYRIRVGRGDSPDRGNVRYNRVGRGLAPAAYAPLSKGRKRRAIRESPLQPVGNGLDRSANLPTCWGGGTRKARDGGAKYIEIHGRAWNPAPTTGRRVVAPTHEMNFYGRAGACSRRLCPLSKGRKRRAIRESPLHPVGNGLDRSENLPTCWGGGTRKARDGGANHIKIYGRAWKPAPTNGAASRRPLRTK